MHYRYTPVSPKDQALLSLTRKVRILAMPGPKQNISLVVIGHVNAGKPLKLRFVNEP